MREIACSATPEYKMTTLPPKAPAKPRSDPRVAKVRSAIHRCKPLVPFSDGTVTVEADPGGKTMIVFSGREAPGDFGRCVLRRPGRRPHQGRRRRATQLGPLGAIHVLG